MKVSIIICTCNRAAFLRETLAALGELHVPSEYSCEVLLLDNASTDDTARVVQECALPNMALRYILEPQRGKCRALNRGLEAAGGDIILFTDDDVRPPRDWVAGMCAPIAGGEMVAAGGVRIAPHLQRPWMQELHRIWMASTEHLTRDAPESAVGANFAFSRRVLEKCRASTSNSGRAR
jgi:glycosyltransferase involved in cell wall biosynthesis